MYLNSFKMIFAYYIIACPIKCGIELADCVTRLGDILDFGQLFKAFGNN